MSPSGNAYIVTDSVAVLTQPLLVVTVRLMITVVSVKISGQITSSIRSLKSPSAVVPPAKSQV